MSSFKRKVAKTTKSSKVLKLLAIEIDCWVREIVALNVNADYDTLYKLSEDKSQYVRGLVCQNPSTPVEILKKMSRSGNNFVRLSVARNMKTPKEVLERLKIT